MIPTSVDIFKASRMKQIEDTTVVSGLVDTNGHLLLKTRADETIDAGNVIGPQGLGFRSRGAWAANTPYLKNDVVTADGSTYVVTTAHTSGTTVPTPAAPGSNLTLWAIKGSDGIIGKNGDTAIPAGTVTMWTSDAIPNNWLLCNGQAVSRAAYPSLFDAIGTKYGAGDGVNTFNLPMLQGRVPVGKDTSQTEFDDLGETGGAKTHLLTASESGLRSHTHTQVAHNHIQGDAGVNAAGSYGVAATAPSGNINGQSGQNTANHFLTSSETPAINAVAAASATSAHNNLQPYTVVNFIIKVTAGETPNDSELAQRLSALEAQFSATPAGTITGWGGSAAPTNWLLCDGSAVSRTLYPSLFAAIGTQYGVGDNATTFNLPNLKGRVPVGRDTAQTEFDVLGETGGTKTHAHKHVSPIGMANGNVYVMDISRPFVDQVGSYDINDVFGSAYYGSSSGPQGPGAMERHFVTSTAEGTIQPYQVINYIIKTTNGDVKGDSQLTGRVSFLESINSEQQVLYREKTKRAQAALMGGGQRKVGDGTFSWSAQFRTMAIGRDALCPSGWFDIVQPPDGTVIPVHGHNTVTQVIVGAKTAGMIHFNDVSGYAGLYYQLPYGATATSQPGRFKIVDYLAGPFSIPSDWILIMTRTVDSGTPEWKWGDGRQQDRWRVLPMINGWANYDGNWSPAMWRMAADGAVMLKGLIANTTNGNNNVVITTFADALSPVGINGAGEIFIVQSFQGTARLDMLHNGSLNLAAYQAGGGSQFVSLANIRWYPKGT